MSEPHPLQHWKQNVRKRHSARIPLRDTCDDCGAHKSKAGKMTRHHEWETGKPGSAPRVAAILCKNCHARRDRVLKVFLCPDCGKECQGRRKHERQCEARKSRKRQERDAWVAAGNTLKGRTKLASVDPILRKVRAA